MKHILLMAPFLAMCAGAEPLAAKPDYGHVPADWTVTPEVEAELATMRANDAYRPHRERPRFFVRTQLKYGLQRGDYLHKWYDRPLLADIRYQEKDDPAHFINIESWRKMSELARLCGHGFAAFTISKGREDILSRSVLPGCESEVLVETVMGNPSEDGFANKFDLCLKRIEEALAATNTFRMGGKLVVSSYPEIRLDRLGAYAGIRKAVAARWGDRVVIAPYFTPFSTISGRVFDKAAFERTKENLRTALRQVDGICFPVASVMLHNRRANPAFAIEVAAPLIHSVLAEPEFKDKIFGMTISCGHENCYRWNYARDCTGTRWMRDMFETVKAFRPDFVNATEWDEENENTHHRPTIAQGFVPQRLLRYETAVLDGRPLEPWPGDDTTVPNLVVSYRKALLAGEPIEVDVLNIPDGTFAGQVFTVQLKWRNAAGEVVKEYAPQQISADELEAAWFVSPVTELVAEPLLRPELTVSCAGTTRTWSDGFWPLSLHVNRSIEFRWVKQALREKASGVTSALAVSEPAADGTVTVTGSVSSPEELRSVEVLDGPDTTYLYDPAAPNPHEDGALIVRVAWQGLDGKLPPLSGTIRLQNAPKSRFLVPRSLPNAPGRLRNASTTADEIRLNAAPVNGWPQGVFARIDPSDLETAEFVMDVPSAFTGTVKAKDVLAKDIVSFPAAGGRNLVFRRWLTPMGLLPPCGGKTATFSFKLKPTSPDSVLRLQTVDAKFHVDYGASRSFFRPSGKRLPIVAFERDLEALGKATVDANRAVPLEYTFSPERGGVVRSGAGLGLDGILCGYNPLVCGYGGAESRDGNVVPECCRALGRAPGWPNTVPEYVKEPDGRWSLRFKDASFVTLPQQVIPAYGGFQIEMDVLPDDVERRQGLLTTGPTYFNLGIENGRVFADFYLRNRFIREPREANVHVKGPAIEPGVWNRVVLLWDRNQCRFEVNGVKGVSYDVKGDLFYARHTALGLIPSKDGNTFFAGRIRRLSVRPLSNVWDHRAFEDLVGKRCWPRDYRGSLFANPPKSAAEFADCPYVTIAGKPSSEDLSAEADRLAHRRQAVLAAGPDYGSDGYCAAAVIGGRVPLVPDDSAAAMKVRGLISDICEDENFSLFEKWETVGSPLRQHSVFRGGTDVWANRGEDVWEIAGRKLPKDGFYGRNDDLESGVYLIGGHPRAFAVNRKEARLFADARGGGVCDFGGVVTDGAFSLDAHNDWRWVARPLPGLGAFTAKVDVKRLFGRDVPAQTISFAGDGHPVEIRFPEPQPIDLQSQIDAATARGGGTVVIPAGDWVSKPLLLKSNVTLRFADGARLFASTNIADYAKERGKRVFLFADGAENIAIEGKGVLDGCGYMFTESIPLEGQSQPQDLPVLMRFSRCRNVRLEDFTYRRSGAWGCHLRNNDGVVVRRVKCFNHCNKTNDGIDCESRNVLIEDCDIDADDDAVCLKAESDVDFAISNVVVRSCRLASCCNGFKVGTGTWAPVKDVLVENCCVERPRGNWRFRWFDEFPGVTNRLVGESAVTLCTVDGGSLENVTVRGMTFSGVATPLSIRLNRRQPCRPGRETYLRDIRFEGFKGTCDGTVPSQITGIPGLPVRNVVLKDIEIECPGGGEAKDDPVPERINGYPGPTMFEGHTLPAHGFYVRHAEGLTFDGVKVRTRIPDVRPALVTEDCTGIEGDVE